MVILLFHGRTTIIRHHLIGSWEVLMRVLIKATGMTRPFLDLRLLFIYAYAAIRSPQVYWPLIKRL